jgi:hypothetical protein
MQCLMTWLQSKTDPAEQLCPLCRQPWEFVEYASPSRAAVAAQPSPEMVQDESDSRGSDLASEGLQLSDGSSMMDDSSELT